MPEIPDPLSFSPDSEVRFRQFFELGVVGMAITSPEKAWIEVNDEMCNILGYDREELKQTTWTELTHPADLASSVALFSEAMTGRIDGYTMDKRYVRKDGRVVHATISVRAIRRPDRGVAYFHVLVRDISARKQAERQVEASGEQLRALSARLNSAREEEGRRIALELHDELGSMLTTLKWDLEHLGATLPSTQADPTTASSPGKIETMLATLESAIRTVRRISSDLRPRILDDLGLVAAIQWQAEHLQERTGIVCTVQAPVDGIQITETEATALVRICQEAITNIIRHAQAAAAQFRMAVQDGAFLLEISDNGRGIDAEAVTAPTSLGLLGMRERARLVGATLQVGNRPAGGVMVSVRLAGAPGSEA